MMAFGSRTMVFSALALAFASPAVAQDAAPAPEAPVVATPAPAAPAAPAMTPEQFMGVPEYMLHLDLSTGGRVTIQLFPHVAPAHVERVKQLRAPVSMMGTNSTASSTVSWRRPGIRPRPAQVRRSCPI